MENEEDAGFMSEGEDELSDTEVRRFYRIESVHKVVLQTSIPAQVRQLILDYCLCQE
jgi:hypothetical protein